VSRHYCGCDTSDPEGCRNDDCCAYGGCDAVAAEPPCVGGLAHRWTSAGTGGCDNNPGCWSLGGTAYQFSSRCRLCGTARTSVDHGWQRNPGECDSVAYEAEAYSPDAGAVSAEYRRRRRNRLARERYAARRVVAVPAVDQATVRS
jgi:hypothetical protein